MLKNFRGIVLRVIKHSDSHSVVTVFCRELGRVSFLTPSGNTREAARRRALLTPFSVVEGVADIRQGHDLLTLRDLMRSRCADFSANPVKSIIALFISDVLYRILSATQTDENLYDFIENASIRLGSLRNGTGTANFHISFLVELLRFMGIEPDVTTFRRGRILDMADGVWRNSAPLHSHYLNSDDAAIAALLVGRMNMRNMHLFRFTRTERNAITDRILDFYSMHISNLAEIKSLDVVRSLF